MPLKIVSLLAAALLACSAHAHAGESQSLSQAPSPPAPDHCVVPAADRFAVPGRGENVG